MKRVMLAKSRRMLCFTFVFSDDLDAIEIVRQLGLPCHLVQHAWLVFLSRERARNVLS